MRLLTQLSIGTGAPLLLCCLSGCLVLSPYTRLPGEDTATSDDTDTDTDALTDTDVSADTDTDTDTQSDSDTDDSTPVDTDTDVPPASLPMITELIDHPNFTSMKWIELHNPGVQDVDLGGYKIKLFSNGNSSASDTFVFPSNILILPGNFVVVANDTNSMKGPYGDFAEEYGREPTVYASAINGNGDDTYVLEAPNGVVIDIYGEIGVDGSGKPWDYSGDRVVKRQVSVTAPGNPLNLGEWQILPDPGAANPFSRD